MNSCAHFYGVTGTGIDLNPIVLKQARAVARLIPAAENNQFVAANLFEFQPPQAFQVVNSLGVLHHTEDCHRAVQRISEWLAPNGYLHLGLYHSYGRRPFLRHFEELRAKGVDEEGLYREFRRLNPEISDETHLRSWFRDQVLHPHETQHSYEEVAQWMHEAGLEIEGTSINHFSKLPKHSELVAKEKTYERISEKSLYQKGIYFPGFFVVWARKIGPGRSK